MEAFIDLFVAINDNNIIFGNVQNILYLKIAFSSEVLNIIKNLPLINNYTNDLLKLKTMLETHSVQKGTGKQI